LNFNLSVKNILPIPVFSKRWRHELNSCCTSDGI